MTLDIGLFPRSVEPSVPAGFFDLNLCDVESSVPDTRSGLFSNNHNLGDSTVRCGVFHPVQVFDSTSRVVHQSRFISSSPGSNILVVNGFNYHPLRRLL